MDSDWLQITSSEISEESRERGNETGLRVDSRGAFNSMKSSRLNIRKFPEAKGTAFPKSVEKEDNLAREFPFHLILNG